MHSTGGRNAHGRITTRHKGGGHKQQYRMIDFRRNKDGINAKVAAIEYDPNRNARIALLHYLDGEKRYIIAPRQFEVGDILQSGPGAEIRPGNDLPIRNIPAGSVIHAVGFVPAAAPSWPARRASSIQLLGKEGAYACLRIPSTEIRRVTIAAGPPSATVGNAEAELSRSARPAVSGGRATAPRPVAWP